jgi:hypothetical protein
VKAKKQIPFSACVLQDISCFTLDQRIWKMKVRSLDGSDRAGTGDVKASWENEEGRWGEMGKTL